MFDRFKHEACSMNTDSGHLAREALTLLASSRNLYGLRSLSEAACRLTSLNKKSDNDGENHAHIPELGTTAAALTRDADEKNNADQKQQQRKPAQSQQKEGN